MHLPLAARARSARSAWCAALPAARLPPHVQPSRTPGTSREACSNRLGIVHSHARPKVHRRAPSNSNMAEANTRGGGRDRPAKPRACTAGRCDHLVWIHLRCRGQQRACLRVGAAGLSSDKVFPPCVLQASAPPRLASTAVLLRRLLTMSPPARAAGKQLQAAAASGRARRAARVAPRTKACRGQWRHGLLTCASPSKVGLCPGHTAAFRQLCSRPGAPTLAS